MKLAFCLFRYFPFGGLQRDFLRIAEESFRRGHEVDIFTMRWEDKFPAEFNVTLIPVSGWQNHTRAQSFVTALKKYFSKKKYDLVIGFNKMPGLDVYYAADTCYQAKARKQHAAWYRFTPRYRHLVDYENAVFSKRAKTNILLISKTQQAEFSHYYQTPSERFHLLPPGISKDRIAPSNREELRHDCRREFGLREEDFLLLMIGSGFKTKGLDRILKGIAALPESLNNRSFLYVIGKDNPDVFLRQAKKLKIAKQIKFLGGRNDVARFLLAADLLLHPAYNENTGTVLLEALVAGLPVLTTDVCGYADYIRAANAGIVLSSPYVQEKFNETLVEMLLSNERISWQKNALEFTKTADIYSMPIRAVDIIERLR